MRARRLSRLAGLVLALAALGLPVGAASGGFSTMDFEWGAPATTSVVVTTGASGSGTGSALLP
jgi:hypothetical protein